MLLSVLYAQRELGGDDRDPASEHSWIHRHVEHFELLDESTIRRRITLDFELPVSIGGEPTAYLHYVPLIWLERENKLAGFEGLRDEEGAFIPIATREDSGELAVEALLTWTLGLVQGVAAGRNRPLPAQLEDSVARDLRRVAVGTRAQRRAARNALSEAQPGDVLLREPTDARFQRAVLVTPLTGGGGRVGLMWFIERLVDGVVLLALIPGEEAQRRRVISMGWIEHAADAQGFVKWATTRAGLSEVTFDFQLSAMESARSLHVQLPAPSDDVEVGWAALAAYGSCIATERRDPARLRHAHGAFKREHADPGAAQSELHPLVRFALHPARRGIMTHALVTCVLSFALLVVGMLHLDDLTREVGGAASLLLFVPGLLSIYVIRPGEHGLASELFSGVRLMVISSAACVLAAGMLIILSVDPERRRALWLWLVITAGVAALVVAGARLRRWRDPPEDRSCPDWARAPAPQPDEDDDDEQPGKVRALGAGAICVAALAAFCGIAFTVVGWDRLDPASRLRSQLAEARERSAPLSLSSFAGIPWTRMYVVQPGTDPAKVPRALGADKVTAGTKELRTAALRKKSADASLLVLVDQDAVVKVMRLAPGDASFEEVNRRDVCYVLVPTDELAVGAAGRVRLPQPARGTSAARAIRQRSAGCRVAAASKRARRRPAPAP